MPFSMLDRGRLEEYMEFYQKVYPERKDAKERFLWQCVKNPVLKDKNHPYVLLYYEGGNIVGQSILNPFMWHFRRKTYTDYFGIDWFLLENYRGPIGSALAIKTIKERPHYFGIGFSEMAEKIWRHLGCREIGKVKKFIWFRTPLITLNMLKYYFVKYQGAKTRIKIPKRIMHKETEFLLAEDKGKIQWKEHPWKDTVEFSRNMEFIRWRFFESIKPYYFYISSDKEKLAYFIVRESFTKGLHLLLLVDYRISQGDTETFNSIIKVSKKIAKINKMNGIYTASSHRFFDNILKKNFFFDTRRDSLFLTNKKIDVPSNRIKKRDFTFVTMADSDMEICMV